MPETDRLALPYPATNDLATVPANMQELAEAAEGQLIRAGAQAKRRHIPSTQLATSSTLTALSIPDRIQVTLDAPGLVYVCASYVHNRVGPGFGSTHAIFVDGSARLTVEGPTPLNAFSGVTTGVGLVVDAPADTSQRIAPLAFLVAPGTFDVELRFAVNDGEGSLEVSERTLMVWTQEFEDVSPS